jgi:hypothetical protein
MDIVGANEISEMIAERTIVRIPKRQTHETEEKGRITASISIDVVFGFDVARTILIG